MRTGKYSGSVINWSDSTPFNGFIVIGLVLPSGWTEAALESIARQRIPQWSSFPIKDGIPASYSELIYNSDINPPNTKYCAYFYDKTWKLLASPGGSGDFFEVSGNWTLPSVTLTAPATGSTAPVPNTPPASSAIPYPFNDGLTWDSTNKRLGIKNSSPQNTLDVIGNFKFFNTASTSCVIESQTGAASLVLQSQLAPVNHRNFVLRTNHDTGYAQVVLSAFNDSFTTEYQFITGTWLSPDAGLITDLELKAPVIFLETNRVQFSDRAGTGPSDLTGNGSPEGVQTATVGSTYRRKDGGSGTSFYVKESGSGNTGWVAK